VQVSGKTIYLPDPYVLPVRNVPVVRIVLGSDGDIDRDRIATAVRNGVEDIDFDNVLGAAIAFTWLGDPEHSRLTAAAEGIVSALEPLQDQIKLLIVAIDGDVGKIFGRLLHRELNWPGKVVSIDGVELQDLDYIDLGELIAPPGIVPVVIKSLLFGS
jgi:ethanolamine utilization protein EutA